MSSVSLRRALAGLALALASCFALASTASAESEGPYHHCAVKQQDKTVWCWGYGAYGALGPAVGKFDDPGLGILDLMKPAPVQVTGVSGARSVTAFGLSSCALLEDGHVQCWGQDPLKDGSNDPNDTVVTVPGVENAVKIAANGDHICAVISSGSILCWGNNSYGQLGDGTTADSAPVPVTNITDAIDVAISRDHSCALLADRTVRCWGRGGDGQLGDGGSSDSAVPVIAQNVSGATSIAASGNASCVTRDSLDTFCWGSGFGGGAVLPGFTDAARVFMGSVGGCVLQTAGTVLCSGDNQGGTLHNGTLEGSQNFEPAQVLGIGDAVDVQVGGLSNCATHANGDVSCWGMGVYGELGTGRQGFATSTTPVPGLAGAVDVAGSNSGYCASKSGEVFCWGRNSSQRFGGSPANALWTPVAVPELAGATGLEMRGSSICGIDSGTVVCNSSAGLAGGSVTDAVDVAVGGDFGCAVRSGGTVSCWGNNGYGQLGDGTNDPSALTQVTGISDATAVSAGYDWACARLQSGSVQCWGNTGYAGQLGDGEAQSSTVPVTVSNLSDATAIAAGTSSTCALRATGAVVCWGSDSSGPLGNSAGGDQDEPGPVTGIGDAAAIFGNKSTFCARRQTGAVSCWGEKGLVGLPEPDGSLDDLQTPIDVPSLAGYGDLVIAQDTGCGIAPSGQLRCWGINETGQLGDGLMPDGHGPQPVPHKVIGFGGAAGPEDDDPTPGPRGDDGGSHEAPPVAEPPAADTPFTLPPLPKSRIAVPQLRLSGRTLTFTNYRVQRSGKGCPKSVQVTVKAGSTTTRKSLRVAPSGGLCLVKSARVALKTAPKSVRLGLAGRGVQRRSVVVKRSAS